MPTIVELPDNTELEFPDGMGQMAMQEEIYKAFPKLREPEGLSSPVTPAETLVPESATIQLPSEAMATASVAPTKEELLANEPNLPISEIGAQQATVPRFGEPGTVTRGVSDIIGGFAEWGMNNPEEALAMLTPQGSAALAMRYMPEIGVQFARDSVAALKGDKEALGRSLALLAPVVAHHGWKAVRADWEAPARAKAQADYNALVDDLARQNLSLEKPAEAQTPVEPPMTMAREPGQDVLLPKARDLTEEEAGQVFNLSALDEQLNKEIESAKEVLPQTANVVEEIVREPETPKAEPKPASAPTVPESVTPVTPEPAATEPLAIKVEPAPVESAKAPEPVPAAAAKVESKVKEVARTEGQRPAKDVTQEILDDASVAPTRGRKPTQEEVSRSGGLLGAIEGFAETASRTAEVASKPPKSNELTATERKLYDAIENGTTTIRWSKQLQYGRWEGVSKAGMGDSMFRKTMTRLLQKGAIKLIEDGRNIRIEKQLERKPATTPAPGEEPPKPGEIVGMGGAVPSEFEPGGSAAIDIYGIAQRVREARAKAGQVASVEPGQGISAPDSVERGRSLLNRGADPERALRNFEDTKKLSADDMAVVRAQGETLAKSARDIEGKFGTESEEYLRAWKKLSDWDKRTKPMQTEWHKMGEAQQGSTDIDTGSFTGLQRAFRDSTGKDFDAKQAKAAEEHVAAVKKAEAEAAEAKQKLVDLMAKIQEQEKARPKISDYVLKVAQKWVDAWKKEADSARKALAGKFLSPTPEDLLNLAKIARADIAELGLDFAKWTDRMVKEFGPKVQPYLKDAWTKGQEMIEGMLGKIKDKEVQQQVRKTVTKATDPVVDLWRKAKDLIDKGETDPEIVFEKLSVDTGVPIDKIREILTKPKGTKRVSDDMYRKLSDRRRVVQAAKAWLRDQQTPGWLKFMRTVPRAFFIDKVFGHGTVGMITHAGFNMFNPHVWAPYWKAFFQQYPLVFSKAYHERAMLDLTRDPNYVIARRAGLVNDPFKYADDYQNAAMKAFFGKLSRLAGGTGFDALKLFRQARFNQEWNALPDSLQTPQMASLLADSINHATGVVKMPFREWTGWTFFAPKLEGSRWAWMFADTAKAGKILTDWKKAAPEERAFAMQVLKERAYVAGAYFGMLALNQGLLKAIGSDQQVNFTNPRQGDFLAFKVAGHKLGVIGPMLGIVKMLSNLYHDATAPRSKLEQLGSRWGAIGEDLSYYGRGKLSPFAGQVANVVSQADYQQRPLPWSEDRPKKYQLRRGQYQYTYPEYFLQEFTPIPVSDAIREVWASQGMDESAIKTAMKAITVGVVGGGTGARISKDYTVEH